ncbi:carbohydrate porin [Prolixibacter sp. SD074]|jgi:porin|uniref:carbohydrate porin n=1 Tax=Prolixibacter sp. SD074 TaxID=2652391 RepID=UPI0012991ADE|nr:carbohydrate porin [Prolixibacter sp. SD074]
MSLRWRTFLLSNCIFCFPFTGIAKEVERKREEVFKLEANYTADNTYNFNGGIESGYAYLGMAQFCLEFDTEKNGWWDGGTFYLHATSTHGDSPSAELIGDVQVASNIEAGNHTFFQEFWFSQKLGQFEITAGLQDLNVEYANTQYAGEYLNSSFGIPPTISCNLPAPIFPLTAVGASVKWSANDKFTIMAALYEGCSTGFDANPHNLKWNLDNKEGLLAISEVQLPVTLSGDLDGTCKMGFYRYFPSSGNGNSPAQQSKSIGYYFLGDQTIYQVEGHNRSLGFFTQLGIAPTKDNPVSFYIGAGINYYGVFDKDGDDVLGLAIAHAHMGVIMLDETAIELTYKCNVTNNIYLQPDFQYIVHPDGTGTELPAAKVGLLRLGITF